MEQFRQIGEVVGSLKALMVFRDEIQINRHQCGLLLDLLSFAYESVAEEMKQNLRFDEKQTKWKVIEQPLKELHRVFKEVELYVRKSLEPKDKWVQTISFYHNKSRNEFHIHNLFSCIPVVIEAIEMAGEVSGSDPDEIRKRRLVYAMKYHKNCLDPKVFQWRFGKQYLVSQQICKQLDSVWEEDRWVLVNNMIKNDQQLGDLVLTNESGPLDRKLLPCSILLSSKDYHVKRRLGSGRECKEIQWRGGTFLLRHFHGDIEEVNPEISRELSLSHPNVMHVFRGFVDDEKKELFLVMELMNRDLSSYIKEIYGGQKRFPYSLLAAVDLMIQIARGMEYLHAKGITHGRLNPLNILVKPRHVSADGYLYAKVSGFGLSSSISYSDQNETESFIWHAPEVLAEQEQVPNGKCRFTEKSDVYSFGMIFFQVLTGKVPFEDSHLQGDRMSRNIRAGERPLFPFHTPKYLTNLTRRCWHADPDQRPSFSSICRILRYIKRFLLLNPDHNNPDSPTPMVDFCETEAGLLKKFPSWSNNNVFPLSQIPFQMFAYRVAERERSNANQREISESVSEEAAIYGDDSSVVVNSPRTQSFKRLSDAYDSISERKNFLLPEMAPRRSTLTNKLTEMNDTVSRRKPVLHPEILTTRSMSAKRSTDANVKKQPATPGERSKLPPLPSRGKRMNPKSQAFDPENRRTSKGHLSDSELT